MVGFIVPIPGKLVDGVYDRSSQFVNSYKKQPVATDLGAPPGGGHGGHSVGEKAPAPARGTYEPPSRHSTQLAAQPRGSAHEFGPQLLDHVLSSLALLQSLGQITPEAAKRAAAALGSDYDPAPVVPREMPRAPNTPHAPPPVRRQASSGPAPAAPAAAAALPTQPEEKRATALWDYGHGGDEDDLVFAAGDTVIIDEEENDAWCRGRTVPKGHSAPLPKKGLFPANYVRRH